MKSFKYWEIQELDTTFGLERINGFEPLKQLEAVKQVVTPDADQELKSLVATAHKRVDFWNEEELKMLFVGPLMGLVQFTGKDYNMFFDRQMKHTVQGFDLMGVVDMVVASGYQKPIEPFFFLHEYKQEKKIITDPLGQLMAAMLVAQAQNKKENLPLHGCYIIGRNWFFVVLKGKQYDFSGAYDSAKLSDLTRIFEMLLDIKQRIDKYFL